MMENEDSFHCMCITQKSDIQDFPIQIIALCFPLEFISGKFLWKKERKRRIEERNKHLRMRQCSIYVFFFLPPKINTFKNPEFGSFAKLLKLIQLKPK